MLLKTKKGCGKLWPEAGIFLKTRHFHANSGILWQALTLYEVGRAKTWAVGLVKAAIFEVQRVADSPLLFEVCGPQSLWCRFCTELYATHGLRSGTAVRERAEEDFGGHLSAGRSRRPKYRRPVRREGLLLDAALDCHSRAPGQIFRKRRGDAGGDRPRWLLRLPPQPRLFKAAL